MFSDVSENSLERKETKCVQGEEAAKLNNEKKSNKAKCQMFSQSLTDEGVENNISLLGTWVTYRGRRKTSPAAFVIRTKFFKKELDSMSEE
jgi:hypothetical protein